MDLNNFGMLTCLTTNKVYDKQLFRRLVDEKIASLRKNAISNGQIVGILNENTADCIAAILATTQVDAIAFPLDKYKADFFKSFKISLIHERGNFSRFESEEPVRIDKRPSGILLMSSGTTGISKGILLTNEQIKFRTDSIFAQYNGTNAKTLCFLPLSFGHGLIANTLTPLLNNQHVVIAPKFSIELGLKLHEIIDEHQITSFSSVPSNWNLLKSIKAKCSQKKSLKQVHCASAPLFENTYRYLRTWVGTANVIANYGLTECGSWIAGGILPQNPADYITGYVGTPLNSEIKVESSLIYVNSKSIPDFYEEPNDAPIKNAEGFLNTGDTGYFQNNELYLTGRVSDFINRGGEKVSAFEIEKVAQAYEGATLCAAIGIDNLILGEEIALVMQVANPSNWSEKLFLKHLSQNLRAYSIPKSVFLLDEIPLSPNGKIDKMGLKKLLKEKKLI